MKFSLVVNQCEIHNGWHWMWFADRHVIGEDTTPLDTFASANMAAIAWGVLNGPPGLKDHLIAFRTKFL